MRRLLLILIPALLLAGLIALNRALADWHYIVSAPPGTVLYAAAFDGFLDEWQLYDDGQLSASAENRALRISITTPKDDPFSLASPHFSDFDLTVQARPLEGPEDNGYGVMFRVQDASNYYQFLVSSDGFYAVQRAINGEIKLLSAWIDSPIVTTGLNVVNTLRVVAVGDRFQFYVNGQRVPLCIPNDPAARSTYSLDTCIEGTMQDTLIDSSIASGRLGVVAQSFEEPGVVVEFDNLVVLGPEPLTP